MKSMKPIDPMDLILEFGGSLVLNYYNAAEKLAEALKRAHITLDCPDVPQELKKGMDNASNATMQAAKVVFQAHYTQPPKAFRKKSIHVLGTIELHIALSNHQGHCCLLLPSSELALYLENIGVQPQWFCLGNFKNPSPRVVNFNKAAFIAEFTLQPVQPVAPPRIFDRRWLYAGIPFLLLLLALGFLLFR